MSAGCYSKPRLEEFMHSVPWLEQILIYSGSTLLKYYLDISKNERTARLAPRKRDPQYKISPIDDVAVAQWLAYPQARDAMLFDVRTAAAPWLTVHTDSKQHARLNLIRMCFYALTTAGSGLRGCSPSAKSCSSSRPIALSRSVWRTDPRNRGRLFCTGLATQRMREID